MPVAKRRQHGDGSVLIWAGIVNQTIIGPFKVSESFKLNSAIVKTFFASQFCTLKEKYIFMQGNAPRVSELTCKLFEHKRFTGKKVMKWPPSSPDLNPIKRLRSVMKMKLYVGRKQYGKQLKLSCWKLNLLK